MSVAGLFLLCHQTSFALKLTENLNLTVNNRLSHDARYASLASLFKQANYLSKNKRYEEAYRLFVNQAPRYEGIEAFDKAFANSAMANKAYTQASYVLERIVSQNPLNADARLQLAIAYYQSDENESARSEFTLLKTSNPPAKVLAIIDNYLDAIQQRSLAYRYGWWSSLNFKFGYDSNANRSTDSNEFLSFELDAKNVATASSFGILTAATGFNLPTLPNQYAAFSIYGYHRSNLDADFINQSIISADIRYSIEFTPFTIQPFTQATKAWLAGDDHYISQSFGVFANAEIDSSRTLNATLRSGVLDYVEALSVRDVYQYSASINLQQKRWLDTQGSVVLGLSYLREDPGTSTSPFGREVVSAKMRYVNHFNTLWQTSFQAQYQQATFERPFFNTLREDKSLNLSIHTHRSNFFNSQWKLGLEVNYTHLDSTVSLYSYDGLLLQASIGRQFL